MLRAMRRRPVPITDLRPRRSVVRALWLPVAASAFLAYFGYHAFTGAFGIWAMDRLMEETEALSVELAGLKAQRAALEAKVARMRPDSLDADLVDQLARASLNVLRADEVVLAPSPPAPR
jgi:cell division protein FtsB